MDAGAVDDTAADGRGAMTRVPVIETELGTERLCRGCGEFWPVDETFWYFKRDGTVMGRCKACWAERRATDDGRMPPLVPA